MGLHVVVSLGPAVSCGPLVSLSGGDGGDGGEGDWHCSLHVVLGLAGCGGEGVRRCSGHVVRLWMGLRRCSGQEVSAGAGDGLASGDGRNSVGKYVSHHSVLM